MVVVVVAAAAATRCYNCCGILQYTRGLKFNLTNHVSVSNSYSIVLLFSVVYRRVQNRKKRITYSCAPTLRSNATTSGLFPSMAHLRGDLPSLQAGGWVESRRIIQHTQNQ